MFSLYSMQRYVNDNSIWLFVFLSDLNTVWLHHVKSLCFFTDKLWTDSMWSPRHICMQIHKNV